MDAKKNVTLEVRLPDTTKSAFMALCRRQDRTASDAVRAFIDAEIDPAPRPVRRSIRLVLTAWIVGLAVGAGLATPSLARSAQAADASFAQLDRNHDGVLTRDEFARR